MLDNLWALVVEDDAHDLMVISNTLKELGIRFKRNTTGANVLEQIRTMQPRPHFILLDIDLPEGDAFHITRVICTDSAFAGIPVVAIGDPTTTTIAQIQSTGFVAFLPKPLPRKLLGNLVARVVAGEQVWSAVV